MAERKSTVNRDKMTVSNSDCRSKQQAADRAIRAARREEYRTRKLTVNMDRPVVRREDSDQRTKDETGNASSRVRVKSYDMRKCDFCNEDPIYPTAISVDDLHNNN